jgi:hypothetical protein
VPIDPTSIVPGKRYVTATRHVRTVLEVTDDRVRFAYGGSESGGVPQWRWQAKAKFAEDAMKEVGAEESPPAEADKQAGMARPKSTKPSSTRTLSKPDK